MKKNLETKSNKFKRIIDAKIEGEKSICIIKLILVGFLCIMIVMAALGFARSEPIIIILEIIAAFITFSSAVVLLIYFRKGKYPLFFEFLIPTLDMMTTSLPFLAVSIGYPVITVSSSMSWLYVLFVFLSARRFSFRSSIYAGILGFILFISINILTLGPLYPIEYTYPDGTSEKDHTGRLLIMNQRGEEIYVGFSILDPVIKGVIIIFSGLIAGLIGNSMKKKITTSIELAEEQQKLRLQLKSSIEISVESSTKTSETISSSFSEISSSTSEMLSTLQNIGSNAQSQVNAVEKSVKNLDDILKSLDSIDDYVSDQLKFIQNASIKSNKLTGGIRKVLDISSKTKEGFTKLVEITNAGQEAIEKNLKAMERISQSSKDILNMNKEINEISENTNVLSINASIEAANAGATGSGFTVLASQIRLLANQTSETTRKINNAIEEILNRIKEGIDSSESVASTFKEIILHTKTSDEQVIQITETTKEQYTETKEIDSFMEQIVNRMNEIIDKLVKEKEDSESIFKEVRKIKELATTTSNAIQEQVKAGEDMLNSTISIASIIEENKDVADDMSKILKETEETKQIKEKNT